MLPVNIFGIFLLFPMNNIPIVGVKSLTCPLEHNLQPRPAEKESFFGGLVMLGVRGVVNPVGDNERHAPTHEDDANHEENQRLEVKETLLGTQKPSLLGKARAKSVNSQLFA